MTRVKKHRISYILSLEWWLYHIYKLILWHHRQTWLSKWSNNTYWLMHFFTLFSSLLTVLLSRPFLSALLRFSLASLGLNRLSSFDCGGGGCGLVVPVRIISFTIHDGEQGWRGGRSGKSFLFTAGGGGGGGISSSSNGGGDCFLGGETTLIGLEAGFICALTTVRGCGVLRSLVIPFFIPSSLQRATRTLN